MTKDCRAARPDQKAAVFIARQPLGTNEFFLEVFQVFVIQCKPPLQAPVGDPLLPLQQCLNLREHFLERHGVPPWPLYSFAWLRTTRRPSPSPVMPRATAEDLWCVSCRPCIARPHTRRAATPLPSAAGT